MDVAQMTPSKGGWSAIKKPPSLDGFAQKSVAFAGETWVSVHDGAGTDGSSTGSAVHVLVGSGNDANKWRTIARSFLLWDTSILGAGVTIVNAKIRLYCFYKYTPDPWGSSKVCVVASNPASNTTITAADYQSISATPLSGIEDYDAIDVNAFHEFELNAAGLAAINKTGITKLGLREYTYDCLDTAPTWIATTGCHLQFHTIEKGDPYKPELLVNYN